MIEETLQPQSDLLGRDIRRTPTVQGSGIRMPIRTKITLPYLILAFLLAVGAAYVVTQIAFDTIEERFNNQLIEGGKLASEWMVREEDRLLETYRLLAHTQGFSEAMQRGDAERLRELAYGIAVNNREEAVEIIDAQGTLLLSMRHRQGGQIEEYDFSRGGTSVFLDEGFVQNVLAGDVDDLGDKYAGVVSADGMDVFYIAGPVFAADADLAGAVLVGKTLPTLVRQIREETLAQVSLYDFDGRPVESTFFAPQALSLAEVADVLERQDEGSFKRNLNLQRELTVANIDYAEILGPWEIRGDVDLGLMGVSLPRTFLVHASNYTRLRVFLLVASAFVLVLVMGVKIANMITRPLLGLVWASTEVANGNLDVQVSSNSRDEVEVLAESFNQMISSLQRSKEELIQAYDTTIEGWSRALDLRDKETEGHSQRVTEMTLHLARWMGMSAEELVHVRRGALLHDIGKMGIPDGILLKAGPLSDEEWEIMRKHPVYSYEMLWPIEYLRPALDIPYCHHERWDGSGYPRGLSGEEIPLAARIFAVVDVWDAMRSDRPYRPAMSKEAVLEHIQSGSGAHFDPQVVEVFVEMMAQPEGELIPEEGWMVFHEAL